MKHKQDNPILYKAPPALFPCKNFYIVNKHSLCDWLSFFLNNITEQAFIVVFVAKSCPTLETPGTVATILLCPWGFLGKDSECVAISFSEGSS